MPAESPRSVLVAIGSAVATIGISQSRGDGAGLLSSTARDVRGELAHVGMRVRAGEHAPHADRADEYARLAASASVRALLPTQAVGAEDVDAPSEHGVRDGAHPRRAPHPRGGSTHHTVSPPCRVERQERRGRQQRGGQSAAASVTMRGNRWQE